MRKISASILFLAIFTFFTTSFAVAQSKTAHINFSELVQLLPEFKTASETLQKLTKDYQTQIDQLTQEFKTKNDALEKDQATMPAAIKDLKIKDLQDLQKKYEEFKQTAQTDIQKKREALFSPIVKKAKDAVEQIAKEKGYGYVIDSSAAQYVYMNPADNILELAKKKLGL